MSYKLHILINHEAANTLEALGLTEQQGEQFKHKATALADKTSEVMLGNVDREDLKKTDIMEEIQSNFSPAEILLLATHSIEARATDIARIKLQTL